MRTSGERSPAQGWRLAVVAVVVVVGGVAAAVWLPNWSAEQSDVVERLGWLVGGIGAPLVALLVWAVGRRGSGAEADASEGGGVRNSVTGTVHGPVTQARDIKELHIGGPGRPTN